ncbi:retention module-containing protein [Methylotenera sp.]|uniref:retention module-containing protein n=1 Tax=Methylotenera sp. TaxID=2051956 RepID=UPI002487E9EC|nr:retention module-containing protein [Methylotenera sp.]MDI1298135.1 retention module-containing protein [Methylotenera sp.]
MAIIGKIVAMTGTAVALSDNGAKRDLHLGDQIQSSDTIQTGKGVFVDLELSNGRVIHIAADQLVAFSPDLTNQIAPDALDSAVNVATIDTVIKAIESGKDINDVIDPTAAGNGSFTIHGFDFVNLLRINDDLNRFRFAYEYDTDGRLATDPAAAQVDDRYGLANTGTSGASNVAPIGVVTPATGAEDGGDITVNLSGTDPDGIVVSLNVTTLPLVSQGVLFMPDGVMPVLISTVLTPAEAAALIFRPAHDFNGAVNIPFKVTDNSGALSAVATTPITVTPVNDPPVAVSDSITPTQDSPIKVPLSGSDIDGSVTSYTITSGPTPAQGKLVYDDDNNPSTPPVVLQVSGAPFTALTPAQALTVQFVPETNYSGPVAPVTYFVTDNSGDPSTPATVTINDVIPVSVSISGLTVVNEAAGTITYTVTLSNPSPSAVTVHYQTADGTATSGTDFTSTPGTLTFAAGETTKTITVAITEDNVYEGPENFTVNLSAPTNATIGTGSVTTTINDDGTGALGTGGPATDDRPAVQLVSSPSVVEGGNLDYIVNLTHPSTTPTVVTLTPSSGTGTLGTDTSNPIQVSFDGGLTFTTVSGATVTVPAGVTSFVTRIPTVNDNISEPNETILLNASTPQNATPVQGTGTIADNDTPNFVINDVTRNEGAGTITFTVSLTTPSSGATTVDYAAANGTATVGVGTSVDINAGTSPLNGTLSFAAGETTKTITLNIVNDTVFEGSESFVINLTNATGGPGIADAQGVGTIVDDGSAGGPDDDRPAVQLVSSPSVVEGGNLDYIVNLTHPSTTPTVVTLTPSSGTGTLGTDTSNPIQVSFDGGLTFTTVSGATVTVPAGVTSFVTRIPTVNDNISEPNETILLNASTPQNATPVQGTGTITDNDGTPSLSLTGPAVVNEAAGTITYTVTLSNPSASPVTVAYGTASGTATSGTDFTSTPGTLTFAAGETTKTITVAITEDNVYEGPENFTVNLSAPTNATIGTGSVTTTINDDGTGALGTGGPATDDRPAVQLVSSPSVVEGGVLDFVVNLSNLSTTPTTVTLTPASGSATLGTDTTTPLQVSFDGGVTFTTIAGTTVSVPANVTNFIVRVPTVDDTLAEGNETITLGVATVRNAVPVVGTGTIIDNEPTIDLDGNNSSGATGSNYTTTFTENTAAVSIADTDVVIADPASATMAGATITLTNAKAGDVLAAGVLPSGITATVAGNVVTLSGTSSLANYQVAIKAITFANTTENPDTTARLINVVLTDGTNSSNTAVTTVNVVAVNDTPTITPLASIAVTEDVPTKLTGLNFGDVDAGSGNVTVTLSVPAGSLTAVSGGGVVVGGSATALTLTGTLASINAFVSTGTGVNYQTALNANGSVTLAVNINDNGNTGIDSGLTGTATNEQANLNVTLNITPVNDAPVNTLPASYTTNEDTAVKLSGLSIADPDAAGSNVTVTLAVGSGSLTAATAGGVTVTVNSASSITLTGSLANINTYLGTVANQPTYTPVANANGTVALTMTTNDLGNTGSGGALQDVDTININITPVNDAPVNSLPASYTTNEDTAVKLSGLSIADPDAAGSNVTVTLAVGSGSLTAATAGGVTVTVNSASSITLTGSLANINTYLGTVANQPTYTPVANANGTVALTMTTNDLGNTGSGGALQDVDTININITAVNDTPTITPLASIAVTEDVPTKLTGLNFGDVDAGAGNVTVTLSVPAGSLTAVSGSGVVVGGSATALTLTGTLASINAFVSTGTGVSYQTVLNANGSVTLAVNINDNGNTGIDPGLTGTATNEQANLNVTLNITPVNDAPVANSDSVSVTESGNNVGVLQNNSADAFVGTPAATGNVLTNDTDPDTGDTKAVTLVNSVAINATDTVVVGTYGNLTIKADGTFTYNLDNSKLQTQALTQGQVTHDIFTYTMKDAAGATSSANLDVTVTGTNDRPVLNLNPSAPLDEGDYVVSFTENGTPISIAAVGMTVTDVDDTFMESATIKLTNAFAGDALAVGSLPSGITASIVGNAITLNGHASLSDYQTAIKAITFVNTSDNPAGGAGNERYIAVTVNDGQAEAISHATIITVNAVNDAPIAIGSTNTAPEDSASITVQLQGSDVDGTVASFVLTTLPINGALYTDSALTILAVTGTSYPATGNALNFYFKPAADWNGTTSLNFNAVDNNGLTSVSTATETIVVTPVDDGPPVAVNDSFQALVGQTITFTRAQLLANDSLLDNATLTSTGGLPTGLTYNSATQTYTYTPTATGTGSFTYTLTDQDGQTSVATVNLQAFNSHDDLATVNESALADGTGGGVKVATGSLFTNDTAAPGALTGAITGVAAGANTTIISNTTVGTVHTIVTAYGTLVVDYATGNNGAYTYTLNNKVDNDSKTGATNTEFVETFTYTRTGGTANLIVTIKDDVPTAENGTVEVPQSTNVTNYNLVLMLDVSGSMSATNSGGGVRVVDTDGNVAISTRLAVAKQAMIDLVSRYFDESASVSVKFGVFSSTAQTDNVVYTTKAEAIAAINGLANLAAGTDYQDGLTTMVSMFGTVDTAKSNIGYFISDGVPTEQNTTNPAGASGYTAFLAANPSVKSYAIGIGGGINNTAPLDGIHNVDADGNNVKDSAILVNDLNALSAALTATIPVSFGGSIGSKTATSFADFGADGGHIDYIEMLLDSNDAGTVPDTVVRFTYNATTNQVTYDNFYLTGTHNTVTVAGDSITLNAALGFDKGSIKLTFSTGDYVYYTQGAAASGDQFDIGYKVIDNDGDTAIATETIKIIDGKPRAYDDHDTLLPKNTFFDGNVVSGISTDGVNQSVTVFSAGAGADNAIDNASVTSIVFKGETFNLTTPSSGTLAGGTYTINAAKELTWTSSTDATNTLNFQSDGYYKYTPPSTQTTGPAQGALVTTSFNTAALVATGGLTILGAARGSNLNTASAANIDYTATGVGITGGNANTQVDNLETLIINFNRANYAQGVQNVTLNINAAGSNLAAGSAIAVSVYDILGNLLGQVAIGTEGLVALPTNWSNIGSIRIEPNSNASVLIDGITFNPVVLNTTATNIADEVIGYTITDAQGSTSSATLDLHVVTNEIQGTVGAETITGTNANDAIAGFAGNDIINAGAGSDIVKGGDGDDTIDGGADDDQLYGDAGNDTITGGAGNDQIYGGDGNDNLQGNAGNDVIYGGAGNDNIIGGAGKDIIIGGAGNDILTGGIGGADAESDTFRWELADKGVKGAPASDTVTDFNVAAVSSGGDVLDLRDLLVSENHDAGVGNLASYLHFEKLGSDTIIHVSSNGEYAAGFNAAKDVQIITLSGVDLVTGFANDQQIIADLLTKQKLITD